ARGEDAEVQQIAEKSIIVLSKLHGHGFARLDGGKKESVQAGIIERLQPQVGGVDSGRDILKPKVRTESELVRCAGTVCSQAAVNLEGNRLTHSVAKQFFEAGAPLRALRRNVLLAVKPYWLGQLMHGN